MEKDAIALEELATIGLRDRTKQVSPFGDPLRQFVGRQGGIFWCFRAYDGQNAPLWKCLRECKLTLMPGELPRYQRVHIGCDRKVLDVIRSRDNHQERAGGDDQSAISRTKINQSSCDCWYHCRILCQRGHHKAAGGWPSIPAAGATRELSSQSSAKSV